jgi:hypothetical protein
MIVLALFMLVCSLLLNWLVWIRQYNVIITSGVYTTYSHLSHDLAPLFFSFPISTDLLLSSLQKGKLPAWRLAFNLLSEYSHRARESII